jgi:hypothetical protein
VFPKVVQVVPMRDYSVYVYFEDGKIVHYDMSKMFEKDAFYRLKDIDFFMDRCTVMNDTLAWDISGCWDNTTCLDIDPDTLYQLPCVKEAIA